MRSESRGFPKTSHLTALGLYASRRLPAISVLCYSSPHMDLVEQIVASLAVEPGQAEKGIGAILMAMRMTVDKPTFEKVRAAVPNLESYMGRALMSGARTGEMIGVAGPAALMAGLSAAGFRKEDVPRLGRIVLEHIRPPSAMRRSNVPGRRACPQG